MAIDVNKALVNTAVAVGAGLIINKLYQQSKARLAKIPTGTIQPGPLPNTKTAVIDKPAMAKAQLDAVRSQAATDVVVQAVSTGNNKVVAAAPIKAPILARNQDGFFVNTGKSVSVKPGTTFNLDKSYVTKLENGYMVFKTSGALIKVNPGQLEAR